MGFMDLKTAMVQEALQGLDVEWASHSHDVFHVDMAKINGYSIIWHEGAYSADEIDNVEVMSPYGRLRGHVPIKNLRRLVTRNKSGK